MRESGNCEEHRERFGGTVKLQLSLDLVDLNQALNIIQQTKDSIDIVEVGTPLALLEGVKALKTIKSQFPDSELLADYKIIDGGYYEASMAFDNGADIVTVLAAASDATINGSIRAAKDFGKEILVDLIRCVGLEEQLKRLDSLGADYVCVHTPIDDQDGKNSPVAELKIARDVIQKSKLAIAGGLQIANLEQILPYSPDIVIVGSGIVKSENMKETAAKVKNILEKNNGQ